MTRLCETVLKAAVVGKHVPTRQGGHPGNLSEDERCKIVIRTLKPVEYIRANPMNTSASLRLADDANKVAMNLGAFNLPATIRLEHANYLYRFFQYIEENDLVPLSPK